MRFQIGDIVEHRLNGRQYIITDIRGYDYDGISIRPLGMIIARDKDLTEFIFCKEELQTIPFNPGSFTINTTT